MSSYESAAWSDACSIAGFIDDSFDDLPRARETYEKISIEDVKEFEAKASSFIADFLGKTEGQRQSFFNKIAKNLDEKHRLLFLTLCLLAAIRVKDLIELRDRYRQFLVPGSGYRVTTKALYEFDREYSELTTYEWPSEPFDTIGADDGAWEDDASNTGWNEETPAPAPTPAPPEPNYHEIVVQHVQSKRFTLNHAGRITPIASGEQSGLWRFAGEDLRAGNVFVGDLAMHKIDDACIRRTGKAFLDHSVPGRTTILVANKTLQAVLAGDQTIGDRVFLAKSGVGQSAFVHWFDDLLDELLLEMDLLGEMPPTVTELLSSIPIDSGLKLLRHADINECDATARRAQAATMCIRICRDRGRDLSHYLPSLSSQPRTILDEVNHGKKLSQTVGKLLAASERGTLTDYGQLSRDVLCEIDDWLRHEATTEAALDAIGESLIQYVAGMAGRRQTYDLSLTFSDDVGHCTPSSDLIMAAVYRRMRRPIPAEWMVPRQPPAYGYHPKPTGYCMAYWIDASIRERTANGLLRSLPYHHGISKALGGTASGVLLGVGRDFQSAKSTYGEDNGRWFSWGSSWTSQLSALLGAFQREESPRPKSALHDQGREPGQFRILLTAKSMSEAALLSLPQHGRDIGRTIEEALRQGLVKAGLRDKVDVGGKLIPYSDPFVPDNSRLAKIVSG